MLLSVEQSLKQSLVITADNYGTLFNHPNTEPIFISFNELRLAKLLFSSSLYRAVDQLVGY